MIYAARLPTVGGDSGQWGTILNEFLNVSLNETGHLKPLNLTLGKKITFALGEIIDNVVDDWIRITGNLNVTNNITASWFKGNLNWSYIQNFPESSLNVNSSSFLDTYDSSYFMPLNTSISGD
ncbi:MAG: hypothetical protein DRI95_04620, partial [Bacteroidetes bacterium]